MEENVKTILDYINTSITGVFLSVNGDAVRFSYDDETKAYVMRNGTRTQSISLNELLVLLNRPELKDSVTEEAEKIKEETKRLEELKEKYLKEVEELDVPGDEKKRLGLLVRQMVLSSDKVGMGNRVTVIDAELEQRRADYIEHRKEYEEKRNKLLEEIGAIDKKIPDSTKEDAEALKDEQEHKWEELTSIPVAPSILSQHLRLTEGGGIQLVTSLDGNLTFHNYQPMTVKEMAEFVKDKELRIDEELVQLFDDYEKE